MVLNLNVKFRKVVSALQSHMVWWVVWVCVFCCKFLGKYNTERILKIGQHLSKL